MRGRSPLRFQPQGPLAVRRQWADRGLLSAWMPIGGRWVDLTGRFVTDHGISPPPASSLACEFGRGVDLNGTNQSFQLTAGSFTSSQAFSRVVVVRPDDVASPRTISKVGDAQLRLYTGEVQLLKSGVVVVVNGAGVTAGKACVVGCTFDAGAGKVYAGGRLLASASPGTTFSTGTTCTIGENSASEYFDGLVLLHLDFSRALTEAEMRSLTENPWQVFQPVTTPRLAAAVAGAGAAARPVVFVCT